MIAFEGDAFGGHVEIRLPEFDAGIVASLDGAHHFVVGGAVVIAEAAVLVVKTVEDDGAVVVGQ